jgi:hypothetical protein
MNTQESSSSSLRTRIKAWLEGHYSYCEFNKPTCDCAEIALLREALAALLSPVEGRNDQPEHVCGLSGFCPAPPHWDECPACNSKETK